jgi:hypothetical protein
VLLPVELAAAVFVGGVETHADGAAAGVVGDGEDAVPAPGSIDVAARFDLDALEAGDDETSSGHPHRETRLRANATVPPVLAFPTAEGRFGIGGPRDTFR